MPPTYSLTDFFDALKACDAPRARKTLAENSDVFAGTSLSLETCVESAAKEDSVEKLKLLVDLGADVNAPIDESELENAVYRGAQAGSLRAVDFLLKSGAQINHEFKGVSRCLALTAAVRQGHVDVVKRLIEAGANINFVWFHQSPLSVAEASGHQEIAQILRDAGAIRIVDEPADDKEESLEEVVISYFEDLYGDCEDDVNVQVVPSGTPISIHAIPPAADRPFVTLFTTGLSDHPMSVPKGMDDYARAELYVQLPPDWKYRQPHDKYWGWPQYWLRSMAQYAHQKSCWLGAPATLVANGDPPKPIAPITPFTTLLMVPDASCEASNGDTIKLHRLLPLYTNERQLEIDEGLHVLMRALDANNVPAVVDMDRKSVVK
jgi:hypothetical protein